MPKTLAEAWRDHAAAIRHGGATDIDCERARLSFYAGAAVALEAVRALGGDAIDEDAAVAHLAYLGDECAAVAGMKRQGN